LTGSAPLATHRDDRALSAEIAQRRTFAIISHPDAGKTTLTEKLLLYGGAIDLAGSVRARRNRRSTTSDWMELERQRGISISSTVLQFPYRGYRINLLDTPGHEDFSEDTYRTLAAVDSAVMVIDAARGIEDQTRKLFRVCRLRGIPIFTFINKLDRPGREPLALLEEIEQLLEIDAVPMNWPIGSGATFRGVYDRAEHAIHLFERTAHGGQPAPLHVSALTNPALTELLGREIHEQLQDDAELLDGAGIPFEPARVATGQQTPVFFGSALTNFGVQLFLDAFVDLAPSPGARPAGDRVVLPEQEDFSGFVFKIQANLDPRHRDSLAFLRVCSGRFQRDMAAYHVQSHRKLRLAHAHRLFGQEREVIEEAYPGDVVGLVNTGQLAIGDTLADNPSTRFDPLPRFQPEHFALLRNVDATRYKRFQAGLGQLEREGAIQVLRDPYAARREPILAAVGELQFDVVQFRLKSEYGVETRLEPLSYRHARWLDGRLDRLQTLPWGRGVLLTEDQDEQPVGLFENDWTLRSWQQQFPNLGYSRVDEPAGAHT
jgi:peptide chain release factor 3